jgi:hypothetical protein
VGLCSTSKSVLAVSRGYVKRQAYLCVFPSEISLAIKLHLERLFPHLTSVLDSWEISRDSGNTQFSLWSTRTESLLYLCGSETVFCSVLVNNIQVVLAAYLLCNWSELSVCLKVAQITRCLLIALMMEAASTSETSVNFYQSIPRNNPEDSHLQGFSWFTWTLGSKLRRKRGSGNVVNILRKRIMIPNFVWNGKAKKWQILLIGGVV